MHHYKGTKKPMRLGYKGLLRYAFIGTKDLYKYPLGFWRGVINQALTRTGTILLCYKGKS